MIVNTKKNINVCLVQFNSSNIVEENIKRLNNIISDVSNVDLIALPEMVNIFEKNKKRFLKKIKHMEDDLFVKECITISKKKNVWIHIGSAAIKDKKKFLNRSILINNFGQIVSYYDKINLFKANLNGSIISESDFFSKGIYGKILKTSWGKFGFCICYDLRFPNIFRNYAQRGVNIIFVPSAFTVETGKAHWETLLKARAIENGVWIIASAQVGKHEDGRETYGHSLIINPWGKKVIDLGGEKPKIDYFEINIEETLEARKKITSFNIDHEFSIIEDIVI